MTPPRLRTRILVGPTLRAQPDRRLVALAREGHEPALEEVVRRYRPALVRYAAGIVPPDRADDVVQDSMARALPRIRDGDAELHLRPWLYTIVRNTALNDLRDAGPALEHLDESYDGVEQPPQALERREELSAVIAGISDLPDAQREALVARELEGRSHAEIGASLGVTAGAARQLIHRGRTALREGLGALVPMPVMRYLLEGVDGPAAAGAGAGGALAAKAAVALLAAGGAVTAGVALDRHSHDPAEARAVVTRSDGGTAPGGGGSPAASARRAAAGGRRDRGSSGKSAGGGPDRGGDSVAQHSVDGTTTGSQSGTDGGPSWSGGGGGDASGGRHRTPESGDDGRGDGSGSGHEGEGSGQEGSGHEGSGGGSGHVDGGEGSGGEGSGGGSSGGGEDHTTASGGGSDSPGGEDGPFGDGEAGALGSPQTPAPPRD
ncbi:MAG: sigma-70 family RNA polymerase sigma factor [Solirubrobacterales bacterium]